MNKKQKSHISISSHDEDNKSFNHLYQKNNKNKIRISLNNDNLEKYLNKLILISLRHKKFLERNDYFYSQLNKKNKIKKVKLKLTPFQKYEKYKNISKKIQQSNSILNSFYPLSNHNKYHNLFTMQNYRYLKKNKTQDNNRFCLTNYHPKNHKNIKIENKEKIFINSVDNNNNLYDIKLRIKKNKYSSFSCDNNNIIKKNNILNINKSNKKLSISNRYKTAYRIFSNRTENNLSIASKKKRSVGVLTSAISTINPLKIINLKSRYNRMFGLPKITNQNKNYQVPLIHMDDSKFLNEITYYK